MRKYEIHLPLNYNDGEPIEQEKIRSAQDELISVFGSCAVPDRKTWKYDGVSYVEIMMIEIVTADDKVPKKSLRDLKERLKESFQQADILMTTHGVKVI